MAKPKKKLTKKLVKIQLGKPPRPQTLPFFDALKMAASALQQNDPRTAANISIQLCQQAPKDVDTHRLAAEAMLALKELANAKALADKALALNNNDTASLAIKARILRSLDDYPQALALLERAIALKPNNGHLHCEHGILLRELGRSDEALAALARAAKINPRITEAHYNRSELLRDGFEGDEVVKLERLLDDKQLSPNQCCPLHFALAKSYGRHRDYAAEMRHLDAGNTLKRQAISYDDDSNRQLTDAVINTVNRDLLSQFKPPAERGKGLIFIVGMPRSGSTLTEQILASHSTVDAAGETSALTDAMNEC